MANPPGCKDAAPLDAPIARKVVISLLLIAGLLIAGRVSITIAHQIRKPPESESTPPVTLVVRETEITRGPVVEKIRGYGVAQPMKRARVAAQVRGTVLEIDESRRVGAEVAEGDVLARIDPAIYRAEVARRTALVEQAREALQRVEAEAAENRNKRALLEADLRTATAEARRREQLFAAGAASESERDAAVTALQAVQQRLSDFERSDSLLAISRLRFDAELTARLEELRLAQTDLGFTEVRAPFDGVIEARHADPGDLALPGAVLFTIVRVDRLELPIEVPAARMAALRPGAFTEVMTDDLPPRRLAGVVDRVSPTISTANRTVGAYIMIDNPERAIAPGAFLTALIDGRRFDDVYSIPRSALVDGAIYVERDGRAIRLAPRIDALLEDVALTADDLGERVRLILSGFERLYDGAPVATVAQPREKGEVAPGPVAVGVEAAGADQP